MVDATGEGVELCAAGRIQINLLWPVQTYFSTYVYDDCLIASTWVNGPFVIIALHVYAR